MKSTLHVVAPATVNRTVTPRRRPNAEIRTREHLTTAEVEKLIRAAGQNRSGDRDATMILVAYRHGLRAAELVDLRWDQVDFAGARAACPPGQAGTPATHPIPGDEIRALRKLQREQDPKSPFVFTNERGSPFTTSGFAKLVERAGEAPSWASRPTPICCGTPAGLRWRTRGTIREACKRIWGTRISSTP